MSAAYDDGIVRVLQGDVREQLATLADESVHCVVTSPPYWGLRDYGTAAWVGGDVGCDHATGGRHQVQGATSLRQGRSNVEAQRFDNHGRACRRSWSRACSPARRRWDAARSAARRGRGPCAVEYRKNRPSAGNDPRNRSEDHFAQANGTSGFRGNNLLRDATTTGWEASCTHDAVGVELNPAYIPLISTRCKAEGAQTVMLG